MQTTISNRTFLSLVVIIFTLAMGFNFVSLFNYYITIFYLYGGDAVVASRLLGVAGTVWAVTGLIAVFPLNWLSRRLGKNKTLLIAIFLMCGAQLVENRLLLPVVSLPRADPHGDALDGHADVLHAGRLDGRRRL